MFYQVKYRWEGGVECKVGGGRGSDDPRYTSRVENIQKTTNEYYIYDVFWKSTPYTTHWLFFIHFN